MIFHLFYWLIIQSQKAKLNWLHYSDFREDVYLKFFKVYFNIIES